MVEVSVSDGESVTVVEVSVSDGGIYESVVGRIV